jgi:putative transposase
MKKIQVFGSADRLHLEAGRERGCRRRGLPQGRDLGGDVYNWRKKHAGLMPPEMRHLRQLEEENGRLKRIVADLSLDKQTLQDVLRRKT